MKENWLNKDLQNKLGPHESSIDLEQAWTSLQAKRNPKKKNRFFIWWFWGLALLCCFLAYFALQTEETPILKKETNTEMAQMENLLEKPIPLKKNINKENDSSNEYTKTTNEDIKPNSFLSADPDKTEVKNIPQKSKPTTWNKPKSEKKKIITKGGSFTEAISNTIIKAEEKGTLEKTFSINGKTKEEQTTYASIAVASALQLPMLHQGLFSIEEKQSGLDFNYSPPKNKRKGALGFSGTYSWLSSGVIHADESTLDALNFDLFYERYYSRKCYFKTGIGFQQYTTEVKARLVASYTKVLDSQLLAINQYPDGSEERVYGEGEVGFRESKDSHLYNRYRMIYIPFLAGYEIMAFGQSNIRVELGMACSVFTKHSGYVSLSGTLQEIEQVADFSKTNVGLVQGLYNLHYQFRLNQLKRCNLFIGLQGAFYFNDIGKSKQLSFERFNHLGLLVGGRFAL